MQVNGVANFLFSYTLENKKETMKTHTKQIKLQISGDGDAVNAAIAVLHSLNFINSSIWSNAVQKRETTSMMRFASRSIDVPCHCTHPESENESMN